MKEGTYITKEQLTELGWLFIHTFGCCEIYTQGKNHIMWNPVTKKVTSVFSSDDRYATL